MPDARKAVLATGAVTFLTGNMVVNTGTIANSGTIDNSGMIMDGSANLPAYHQDPACIFPFSMRYLPSNVEIRFEFSPYTSAEYVLSSVLMLRRMS